MRHERAVGSRFALFESSLRVGRMHGKLQPERRPVFRKRCTNMQREWAMGRCGSMCEPGMRDRPVHGCVQPGLGAMRGKRRADVQREWAMGRHDTVRWRLLQWRRRLWGVREREHAMFRQWRADLRHRWSVERHDCLCGESNLSRWNVRTHDDDGRDELPRRRSWPFRLWTVGRRELLHEPRSSGWNVLSEL